MRSLVLLAVLLLSSQAPLLVHRPSFSVLEDAPAPARADTLVSLTRGDCVSQDGDCDSDNIANGVEDLNGDGDFSNDDTDGDGTPDYQDTDDDDDGWPTWFECPDGRNTTANHCVGLGETYDYLHDQLFNCNQPIVTMGQSTMDVYAYFWTNDTLVLIGDDVSPGSYGVARSHEDGKLYYVSSSSTPYTLHSWNYKDGESEIADLSSNVVSNKGAFNESGDFFFEYQDDVYSIDISDGTVTTIDDTFGDPGTNGGDLAAHPDNGTWYFVDGNGKVSSASTDFSTFQNEYEIPTVFAPSGITSYPGATILENGTLLFNQGQKLYATTGDWANGSGGVTQLNDGSTLGGDMATCTTPYSDSDNDGLQDFLEENVHSTDPHDTDTDDDGLEDYSEILNGTDPTNPDSDGDGLFDGHEVSIGTDPNTVEDTDGDGTPDWWDEDEDGDGISGTLECRPSDPDAYQLLNGGFEEPDQSGTNQQHAESNVPSWNTTESDSDGAEIEIWQGSGYNNQGPTGGAYAGDQYAEINADQAASLYQDFNSTGGDIMVWSYHHARRGSSGTDQMMLRVGPAGTEAAVTNLPIIDYSNTSSSAWVNNNGSYLVPDGQTRTRFAFAANGGGGSGNFVDGILFRPVCTLDTDGDGIVNALDLDSDGDGVEDANESWTLDHDGDGVVNALDNDSDGDGVLDGVDPSYTRASVTYAGLTMYAGVDIGTWEPTNAGGDGETFVVTPSLPDGLSFDATSGNITGAPTSNQSETTHTVWTNNTGGSNSTSISITVIEPTPSITASVASVVMNVNVNISAITMANAGGVPSSWEVHPALPTGLTLDGFTGSISGSVSSSLATTAYTIYANNSNGSSTQSVTLSTPTPPDLSGNDATLTITNGTAFTWTPSNSGGAATTWSLGTERAAYAARWKFDENTSTSAYDDSPSNNTGTVSGPTWITGKFGTALSFDGTDDTVTVENDDSLNLTQNFSIETWIWLDSGTTNPTRSGNTMYQGWVILDAEGDGWDGYMFGIEAAVPTANSNNAWSRLSMLSEQQAPDGNTCSSFQEGSSGTVVGRGNVTKGQWNHVAVVYNASVSGSEYLEFYINGVLDVRYQCAFTFTPNDEKRSIGSEDGGQSYSSVDMGFFDGRIDQLGVWKRVLNATEIESIHNGFDFTELPDGVVFDSATGVISGTPTDHTFPDTSYTVTATNGGGSSTHTIRISLVDALADISYSPSSKTLTKSSDMGHWTATNGGGTATSWEIHPSLPSGLQFDASNGTISGTPSVNQTATTYTVYANNSGGANTTTVTITINEVQATLTPASQTHVLTKDAMIEPILQNLSGGVVATWAVHPALPSGLHFNTGNGTITGTPDANQTTTTYTIYANNSGGDSSSTLSLTINEAAPVLTPSTQTHVLTKDAVMVAIVQNVSGGIVATWAIHPALPTGMHFNTGNGTITGTPGVNQTATTYTIYANNSGGDVTSTVSITVNEPSAILSPASQSHTFTRDVQIEAVLQNLSGGGTVATWTVHPTLPSGLHFNTGNGTITGTPTTNLSATTYTIHANNSGGSASSTVTLTIHEPVPEISPASQSHTFTRGVQIEAVLQNLTAGVVVGTWEVHPSLPTGFHFNAGNGTITGTPSGNQSAITYTIYANTTGGSDAATVVLTVNEPAPVLSPASQTHTLTRNSTFGHIEQNHSGGVVNTWAIHPSLPAGLTLHSGNGSITGTPTVNLSASTYTLYANNTGGTGTATLTLTILEQAPVLSPSSQSHTLTKDASMGAILINSTAGTVSTWAIHPALPSGLEFNTGNGTITGTPDDNMSATTYRVHGNNTQGNAYVDVTLTIVEPTASLSPSSQSHVLTKDAIAGAILQNLTGGVVATWAIHPALPTGMHFNTGNGTITGTPSVNQTSTTYTIYANNSGGDVTSTLTLTINEPIAVLSPASQSHTFTKDAVAGAILQNLSGGVVATWAIHPALPTGMHFNTGNGTITGTPGVNQTSTTYTIYANNSGGDASSTVSITINEPIAVLSPSSQSHTFTKDAVAGAILQNLSGGVVATWAIHPALPTGMHFNTGNGTITGTPSVNQTATTYTIYANNSGGDASSTVSITINEPIAVLSPASQSHTFTKDAVAGAILQNLSGGVVATWAIHPALPTGMHFNTGNGTITGTPSVNQTATTYTIYANNSGGDASSTVSITINEPIAVLSPSSQSHTLTRGVDVGSIDQNLTGGVVATWAVHPSLPNGLEFDTYTGSITGAATINLTSTTYTIYANNSGGDATAQVTLVINEPPAGITASNTAVTLTKDALMTNVTFTLVGGAIDTWEIHPSLPDGLTLNTGNGTISGTPTANQTSVAYRIYANNTGGSAQENITITINEPIAVLSPASQSHTLTRDVVAGAVLQNLSGGGVVATWAIHPSLPNGMHFNTGNGTITGTPSVNQSATTYTVYANNSGGDATSTITITVNEPIAVLSPASQSHTFTKDAIAGAILQNLTGGVVATWAIHPTLPTGMHFNTGNGTITGTPSVNQSATTYTVYANNTGGDASTTVSITVNEPIAVLSPASQSHILTKDAATGAILQNLSGGVVATWAIHPSLPNGMHFNTGNGTITGTPDANQTATTYTIYANNSGGDASSTVSITVNEPIAVLSPASQSHILTKDAATGAILQNLSGGVVATWAIHPSLPNGMHFNTGNGTITGTPDANQTATTYTIYANNSGGDASTTVSITVNEPIAVLSPASQSHTFTRDVVTGAILQNLSGGGVVATWAIHPSLPNGMHFNTGNGTITGTPDANQTATTYTIYANNSGGDASTTVSITVNEPIAVLSPGSQSHTFTRDVVTGAILQNLSGGGVVATWAIHPSLPNGMHFNTGNGTITGTPDANQTATTYTIYANNSGGDASTTVSITVNEPIAVLSPASQSHTLTRGVDVGSIDQNLSGGGVVATWAIHPALPNGLEFDAYTGSITGSPTVNLTSTTYTIYANNTGGDTTSDVVLVINEPPAGITASNSALVLTKDAAMTSVTFMVVGGTIDTWEIHPTLPDGLTFDATDGTIAGTPTANQTSSSYRVYANNTGGTAQANITITINEPIAVLNPASQSHTLIKDAVAGAVLQNLSGGGVVATWAIHPALPTGLHFNTGNGTITGTPGANQTATTYTIYANNSGGDASATVSITVNEPIAVLSPASQSHTFTKDAVAGAILQNLSGGGVVATWAIHPALPAGMHFNTGNGTITGTPTGNQTATTYTIHANNSGGDASTTVSITVNEPIAALSPASQSHTFTKDAVAGAILQNLSGGVVATWAIHPALPTGLHFNTGNGTITGTPSVNQTATTYTIYANNSGGDVSTTVSITVNEPIAVLSPASQGHTYTRDEVAGAILINLSGGGVVASWEIHPALPSGMSMNGGNGTITGTPDDNQTSTTYTIYANNSGGSGSAQIIITVNEPAPSISLSSSSQTLERDDTLTAVVVTTGDGVVNTWEVHPALPSGLSMNVGNGTISGSPDVNLTQTVFTIYANNSGGSDSATFTLTVNENQPDLTISNASEIEVRGATMAAVTIADASGGVIDTWEIDPVLPSGLSFNTGNGTISGTPGANLTSTVFTIWANNTGGSDSITFTLVVNEPAPVLSPATQTHTLARTIDSGDILQNLSGIGIVDVWAIHPSLPAGLHFNTGNGTVSGIPTVNLTSTTYTIYANNTGGSVSTSLTLTITEPPTTITDGDQSRTFVRTETITPIEFNTTGGVIDTWEISASLPDGLDFDASNGTITGTPTTNLTSTTWTIWANNTGGSDSIVLTLVINEAAPVLTGSTSNTTFTRGQPITPITIGDSSNGTVNTWEVVPALPDGLELNTGNGTITGTPTGNSTWLNFTVWANNSGGSAFWSFSILTFEPAPVLDTNTTSYTGITNRSMRWITISKGSGVVDTWAISPALPNGLTFNTGNGSINGTPDAPVDRTTYTISATNSGGTDTIDVNLTFRDPTTVTVLKGFDDTASPNFGFEDRNGSLTGEVSGGPSGMAWQPNGTWLSDEAIIGVSSRHACMVLVNGSVACWGSQANGRLGNGQTSGTQSTLVVVDLPAGRTAIAVAVGSEAHSCALLDNRSVVCWGFDDEGQLGNGAGTSDQATPTYVDLPNDGRVVRLTAGRDHTCAILDNGSLWCWGRGNEGQLGNGATSDQQSPVLVQLPTGRTARNVSAGTTHTCAVLDNGSISCWGQNVNGQLGIGTSDFTAHSTPEHVTLPLGREATDLHTGRAFTCAHLDNDSVMCWGDHSNGRLGAGSLSADVTSPDYIDLDSDLTPIAVYGGLDMACVLLEGGGLRCWGNGADGRLGTGDTTTRDAPHPVSLPASRRVIALSSGSDPTSGQANGHTCAVLDNGSAVCWGDATHGALGHGSTSGDELSMVHVSTSESNVSTLPSFRWYGQANALDAGTTYTVWGNNSTHRAYHITEVTVVVDRAFEYTSSPYTLTRNTTNANIQPTERITGLRYSITPSLPAGLDFDAGSGAITGIPTEAWSSRTYTITATMWNGSASMAIDLEILDIAPAFSPSNTDAVFTKDVLITSITMANTGGNVTFYSISPSLPTGMNLDPNTGVISGTPSVNLTRTLYTITATNSIESTDVDFHITVNEAIPDISVDADDRTGTRDEAIVAITMTNAGGKVNTYEISPALPNGLELDPYTGSISGTPSQNLSRTEFTIWANNTGGSDSIRLNITVNEPLADLTAQPEDSTHTLGVAITPVTFANAGGVVDVWAIDPALPSGLEMDEYTGTISGTPTVNQTSAVTYTVYANNSGGAHSISINLTINDPVASIIPSLENTTGTEDVAITDITFSVTGVITSWEIVPALPSGLNIDGTTGRISGAADENLTRTSYTVYANNTGGSTTVVINITINEPLAALSMDPTSVTGTRALAITPAWMTPSPTDGVVDTWEIHPALPDGLLLHSGNGSVYGTPTTNLTATTFTIFGNNSGGSVNVTLTLTINEPLASLAATPTSRVGTRDVAFDGITIANTGGQVATWQVEPALPAGLELDPFTGEVSGTPSVNSTSTVYTIWANNSGGAVNVTVTIEIREPTPSITASADEVVLTRGVQMSPSVTFTSTGGNASSWEIHPALPNGLLFDASSGRISGTPSENLTRSEFRIYANSTGGSTNATVNITVNEPRADLTASTTDVNLTRDIGMTPILVSNAGGFAATWEIHPSLPASLVFEATNGTISGTPDDNMSATTYRIYANNTGGSAFVDVTITVREPVGVLSVASDDLSGTRGVALPQILMANSGGVVDTWEISPALPLGLNLDPNNGNIAGTPSVNSTRTEYTIWANNTGGSAFLRLNITIVEPVADLDPEFSDLILARGVEASRHWFNNTGGVVDTWEIHPALPDGLSLHSGNGSLSGTPSVNLTGVNAFTIYANNTGGSAQITVNITVNEVAGVLTLDDAAIVIIRGEAMTPITVQNAGGLISTWEVDPTLPDGLSIDGDGRISGTPNGNDTAGGDYRIWANNSGGDRSIVLNITIHEPRANLTLSAENTTVTRDTFIVPITVSNDGGVPESWEIHPSLPTGLNLDPFTGTIDGKPTGNLSRTTYTLWANNSGGDVSILLNITIPEPLANLSIAPTHLNATRTVAITPVILTNTGGVVDTWEVVPALPQGLELDPFTGRISGLPTVNATTQVHTIWANNSGGQVSIELNLTVLEPRANLTASPENLTGFRTVETSGIQFPNVGGVVNTWAIMPALPSGLAMDPFTGSITGVPGINMTRTVYTVWANNSGGTHSIQINITLHEPRTEFSMDPENLTATRNVSIDRVLANISNPAVVDVWAIHPSLPLGMEFNLLNGSINGTPLVNQSAPVTYTIYANNTGGSASAAFNLTILEPVVTLVPDASVITLTRTHAMTPWRVNVTGGVVQSWQIAPDLPLGLQFDALDGSISGTPQVNSTAITYTVWGNTTGGASRTNITIRIVEPVGSLTPSVSNLTAYRGHAIVPITITDTSGAVIDQWAIEPTLPLGLSFNVLNGTIDGTPSINVSNVTYTIWGNTSGGPSNTTVHILLLEPPAILAPDVTTLVLNRTITAPWTEVTNTGGVIHTWEVHPPLPAGLHLHDGNGTLHGTPIVNWTTTVHTIFANNSGGSDSYDLTLTVGEIPPVINISVASITATRTEAITPITITSTEGVVNVWSIDPALPDGLSLDPFTGAISGTPNVTDVTGTSYTILARNSAGEDTATVTITILEPRPVVTANVYLIDAVVGLEAFPVILSNTGGPIESIQFAPQLPAGLVLNETNLTIHGIPQIIAPPGNYTITFSNSGGQSVVGLDILIRSANPVLEISNVSVILTRDQAMPQPVTFQNGGGPIDRWTIQPDLPTGLMMDAATGRITGTPSVNSSRLTYIITAYNDGGSDIQTLNITVREPAPQLHTEDIGIFGINHTRSEAFAPILIQNLGGTAATWTIEPSLPPGLTFDPVRQMILGAPSLSVDPYEVTITAYTYPGEDHQESSNLTFRIDIVEPAPDIRVILQDHALMRGRIASPIDVLNSGGLDAVWTVNPPLPDGLTLVREGGGRRIVGSPTVNSTTVTYSITAQNANGIDFVSLTIRIDEPPAEIEVNRTEAVLVRGEAITEILIDNTGGAVGSWQVAPPLPLGLAIDPLTSRITGTPLYNQTRTVFTVYGNNTGGSSVDIITLTIVEPAPSFQYDEISKLLLEDGYTVSFFPVDEGGPIATYLINPQLPNGLRLDPTTGEIYGSPTQAQPPTTYTITGRNSGGSWETQIELEVVDPLDILAEDTQTPWAFCTGLLIIALLGHLAITKFLLVIRNEDGSFEYSPKDAVYGVGIPVRTPAMHIKAMGRDAKQQQRERALIPQTTLKAIDWRIEPELPAGLVLDPKNGAIRGVPKKSQRPTVHRVTLVHKQGEAKTKVRIAVRGRRRRSEDSGEQPNRETADLRRRF